MAEIETRYPIQIEQDVAWGEQDSLGHVNNTVFFRYFENARVVHFRAIGVDFPEPGTASVGPILASTRCDFLRPLTFPDHIRVEVGVSRVGNSSFTHAYRIYSQKQAAYVAQGESVTVYFDYRAQRSTPLPEAIRKAIVNLEQA